MNVCVHVQKVSSAKPENLLIDENLLLSTLAVYCTHGVSRAKRKGQEVNFCKVHMQYPRSLPATEENGAYQ